MVDETKPVSSAWWAFLLNPLVRKVAAFIAGALLLAACGLLPAGAQGLCRGIVAGVQSIISSAPTPAELPQPEDPLRVLRENAGLPGFCVAAPCQSLHGGFDDFEPDGGRCRCPVH